MTTTNKTVEEISRETADKIWNQNGKHTHSELDATILSALTQVKEDTIREVLELIKESGYYPEPEIYWGDGEEIVKKRILSLLPDNK